MEKISEERLKRLMSHRNYFYASFAEISGVASELLELRQSHAETLAEIEQLNRKLAGMEPEPELRGLALVRAFCEAAGWTVEEGDDEDVNYLLVGHALFHAHIYSGESCLSFRPDLHVSNFASVYATSPLKGMRLVVFDDRSFSIISDNSTESVCCGSEDALPSACRYYVAEKEPKP